jgi:hypothetical protein
MDTTKIATMKLDQRWFLEKGLTQYYGFDPTHASNAAEIPDEFKLFGRFLTIDDTTGLEVEDRFELLIKSSMETPVDLCNTAFSAIAFVDGTQMTVPRTFDVNDEGIAKAIYIPTEVSGLENLGSCRDMLFLTLDYETSTGLYKTAWSERSTDVLEADWPVWVEEIDGFKHLMLNITHEQYVYGLQMKYNSIDPSITAKL